jgi:hypothetical protein
MRFVILSILFGFATAALAADVGEVKVARGTAFVERGAERLPARVGMPLAEGDRLVTGADGALGVTFADNSLLSLGPDSSLAIDRYAFDSTTHAGQFDSTLSKGSLAMISGKMVKQSPDAMRIRTPSSIMGVRGTEFVVQVAEKR